MGYTINYRSARPVTPEEIEAIEQAARHLCEGYTWLSCEPPLWFHHDTDEHVSGGCKPNLMPDPTDAAAAAREELPDGTPSVMLEVLCELSREHAVDWEIIVDPDTNTPAGHVRAGVADERVEGMMWALTETIAENIDSLGDLLDVADAEGREVTHRFPSSASPPPEAPPEKEDDAPRSEEPPEEDDDGPPILKFRPRGS